MGATTMHEPYWTLVDEAGKTKTYEHHLPHGTLIRVSTVAYAGFDVRGCAESVVFVPSDPAMEPYR